MRLPAVERELEVEVAGIIIWGETIDLVRQGSVDGVPFTQL